MRKVFVRVLAEFDEAGVIRPQRITWEDGRQFTVDSIVDIRPAVSTKVGGQGIRYTCSVCGKRVYLFRDRNFCKMEGKERGPA